MLSPWHLAFGTEINQGFNSASVNAGNGVGNQIDGSVVAIANQSIGDSGFDFGESAFESNFGFNSATVDVGNGLFNQIGGDVMAIANQSVGDVDALPFLF
ncbi:hypothetical protein [Mongoliimonas terrestris]|uniref:hypothetical protein n=1 Tax=Mongoliimonas terrestris TaxID=1709001 RepID=UPI000949709B|nr:hypothetical protein [Mongoliimonas terrestris]